MRRYILPCILLLADILSLIAACWLSVLIRFSVNDAAYTFFMTAIMANLPFFISIHLCFFTVFNLYTRAWRYAGKRELLAIIAANACGVLASFFVIKVLPLQIFSGQGMSRGIFVSCFFFDTFFVAASRYFVQWASYRIDREERIGKLLRVLIIGAGDAGNIILRDIQQRDNRKVVGFVDDDPAKWGQIMNGVKVYGGRKDIPSLVEKFRIEEIIIAIPSLEAVAMSDLAEVCASSGAAVQILPEFFPVWT